MEIIAFQLITHAGLKLYGLLLYKNTLINTFFDVFIRTNR